MDQHTGLDDHKRTTECEEKGRGELGQFSEEEVPCMSIRFSYAKGRKFEYKVRNFFEKKGFYVVRSAKSSFPDLIVIAPKDFFQGEAIFIECKNKEKIPANPIKLLTKEEYADALQLVSQYDKPFLLCYKEKRKIKAINIGGLGVFLLNELGL